MRGAERADFVLVVMDRPKVDVDIVLLQKKGWADGQLAQRARKPPARTMHSVQAQPLPLELLGEACHPV